MKSGDIMLSKNQPVRVRSGKCMVKYLLPLILALSTIADAYTPASVINFTDNWGESGFNLVEQNTSSVEVVFSVSSLAVSDISIDGEVMQNVLIPGVILPNEAGAPNLPGSGRFIAIPEGAAVELEIIDYTTEILPDMNIAPAFEIPRGDYDGPLVYKKDYRIYGSDANYPSEPVTVSDVFKIRGVDAVILGITPFQYNPVSGDLIIYKDIRIRLNFIGGNGHFGEDRLRSRYWEPVLQSQLLNYYSLPGVDFNRVSQSDEDNVEYLIIVPDDPDFLAWADTLKRWRNEQGIITGITTLSEIGGNDANLIENYIDNAYATWDPAPAGVLILSDYQGTGDHYGITAPTSSGVLSDNKYADIDGDNLPDLFIGRICAQNEEHLSTMIGKMLSYEREPYTDPNFYDDPLIAGGWQSDRWFILCCEVLWGYFHEIQGKNPERQYSGTSTPPTVWSTNGNTYMIIDYFGPRGLEYIPQSPSHLTNWTGSAGGINRAIEDGTFIVQHRDHGSPTSWGDPAYNVSNVNQLTNNMYPYIFSTNCSTGKYNNSTPCLAEAFHRSQYGAIGVNAASGTSYSFVNDTFVWGMYDSMFPDFDPGYPAAGDPLGQENLRPGVANVNGKYFLEASNWPYNQGSKTITYHLFHHHGDAFMTLYSEVPQELTVVHADELFGGVEEFTVTADEGALIGLSVDGECIGAVDAIGTPQVIDIIPQVPGSTMKVTVTKSNYYRYMSDVTVTAPTGAHCIFEDVEVSDELGWNPNNQLDYDEVSKLSLTMYNIGVEEAEDVEVTISTEDTLIVITDNTEYYGSIAANSTLTIDDGFEVIVDQSIPDEHIFNIAVSAVSGTITWESSFEITGHAAVIVVDHLGFSDPTGNNNGWLDPGETADMEVFLANEGSAPGHTLEGTLTSLDPLLTINTAVGSFGDIAGGETGSALFNVTADPTAPQEYTVETDLTLIGDHGIDSDLEFDVIIGNVLYDATGPDNYGYLAYDPHDTPELPVYEWVEICADSGGPGTLVDFTSGEQVFQYGLPFTFQYYGAEYDTFSIATNGWIAMGIVTHDDYSNSGIPNSDGPENMIAAYWEDLSPQRPNSGKIWQYYDENENRLIVEYNYIEQYSPLGAFETFQVILYNPIHHPTLTGDGRIKFQYKEMSSTAIYSEGTIGIENAAETDGLQYFFDGDYDWHAHTIENEFAILFSTLANAPNLEVTLTPSATPIQIPATGGDFDYNISVANNDLTTCFADVWCDVTLPDGSTFGPVLGPVNMILTGGFLADRDRTQVVPGTAPEGEYTYNAYLGINPNVILAEDHFTFEKLATGNGPFFSGWSNTGESFDDWFEAPEMTALPSSFELHQNHPNPFNPTTTIEYSLPEAVNVKLSIFNTLGQEIAVLVDGFQDAGSKSVEFDAGMMSSGIYFYRIEAGDFRDMKKMALVK